MFLMTGDGRSWLCWFFRVKRGVEKLIGQSSWNYDGDWRMTEGHFYTSWNLANIIHDQIEECQYTTSKKKKSLQY